MLKLQVDDIYFLTCLSRRGAPISFFGARRDGETAKIT